jgi:hypothetical protein
MLASIEVEPIPPEQIVNAAHDAGEKIMTFGQGLSEPAIITSVTAAGIVILVGLVLAALGVTKRILSAGGLHCAGRRYYVYACKPTAGDCGYNQRLYWQHLWRY